MPVYDLICDHCDRMYEDVIAHIDEDVPCDECGKVLRRIMSPVNFNMGVGAYGYYDETLDKYIPTNRARREEMRKQGVTPKGETPKPDGDAWV